VYANALTFQNHCRFCSGADAMILKIFLPKMGVFVQNIAFFVKFSSEHCFLRKMPKFRRKL
jgi:hypothetical protein